MLGLLFQKKDKFSNSTIFVVVVYMTIKLNWIVLEMELNLRSWNWHWDIRASLYWNFIWSEDCYICFRYSWFVLYNVKLIYSPHFCVDASVEESSLSLIAFTWEVWSQNRVKVSNCMTVFDLNQWYQEHMPNSTLTEYDG